MRAAAPSAPPAAAPRSSPAVAAAQPSPPGARPARLGWGRVLRRAGPLALGYLPIGFAFAAMAELAGLPAGWVFMLSASVFACSSQIVGVQLWAAGEGVLAIALTTLVVNLRHVLMSSVAAGWLGGLGPLGRGLFCFHLCDEAFAMHVAAEREAPFSTAERFAANGILYVGWLAGNSLAFVLGLEVDRLRAWGLDFAPMAMFVALLAMLVRDLGTLALAVGCAAAAVALRWAGAGAATTVLTALGGATLAMGVQRCHARRLRQR